MTESVNGLLCDLVIASCAVLACSKTCFGTGRSLRLVNFDIMTESINGFLCDLVIASCAVFACSKTGFCTSGSLSFVNFDIVSESINGLLSDLVIASCAVLACSQTCFCTSGSLRLVNYDIMTERRDSFLCFENLTAYRTFLSLGKTGFGTVSVLCRNCFLGMFCAEIFITYVTDIILGIFVGMTLCRNYLLCLSVVTS